MLSDVDVLSFTWGDAVMELLGHVISLGFKLVEIRAIEIVDIS